MTTRPDAADLFALTDEEDDPPMTNPSPYPATREYDIDVDVTLHLTIREELPIGAQPTDVPLALSLRDNLIQQVQNAIKHVHADLVDIEWNIIDVRTP